MQDECWDTFPGVMNVGVGAGSPSMVENFELCPQISPYPLDRTITAPRTALLSPWTPTPHLPRCKSTFSTSPQLPRTAQTFPCRTVLFSGSSPGPFPREMPTPPNTPRELHPKLPLFSGFSHSALTGGAGGAG